MCRYGRPLLLLAVLGLLGGRLWGQEEGIGGLATVRDFEANRITSADPKGGNEDWWDIAPGETKVLAHIRGPGRIVHFRDNITSDEPHHLQTHVLRIFWDGQKEPSVEAPVGDFFGVGFGFTEKFRSALLCIDQRRGPVTDPAASGAARNCYFPMPYARSARITLTNEGKRPSRHWFEINTRTYAQPQPDQLYFHAQYRQGTPPAEGPYVILEARGRGHLAGCVLSVKNNDGDWWGEGDEIVEVDGKKIIQGTGSEDYFCESYGLRQGCFPYFGVPLLEEPYTTAYRWHVPDPVPFRKSMRFLIEHGNGNPPFKSGNFYYSVAYWYQTLPHAPFPALPGVEERLAWAPSRVQGAVEAEDMKVLARTGGTLETQTGGRWSKDRQLWWRDGKPGDRLELALPVAKAGRYRLVIHTTRADDYGTFQFTLDGDKLGGPVDLYSAENVTRVSTLGSRELTAGEHRLGIAITGANPAAKPRHMLGLDYVKLEPVP